MSAQPALDVADRRAATAPPLVLALGNRLMTDDAAGPLALERVRPGVGGAALVDGGTCGLALLPAIEDAGALIVLDAAKLGRAPGAVTVLEGTALDAALAGVRSSAHEVALADLLDAARVTGRLPARRALVAIEPDRIGVGVAPTPDVAAALPRAAAEVHALLERWSA